MHIHTTVSYLMVTYKVLVSATIATSFYSGQLHVCLVEESWSICYGAMNQHSPFCISRDVQGAAMCGLNKPRSQYDACNIALGTLAPAS